MVHAAGPLRPGAADRRPHGLGAERRLARRLPERHGRRRGAAADRCRGRARRDRAPRQLGRRGGRALRALAVRLVGRGRLDGRSGRACAADGSRRDRASGCARRVRRHLEGASRARAQLADAAAYLELHIEQGPVLESMELAARRRARHVRRRALAVHLARPGGARGLDADERAPRRACRGGQARARDSRHRARGGRRCGVHVGRRRLPAGDRHVGRRDRRAAARPASPRRGVARPAARAGARGRRPLRRRGEHHRRVGADLEHRADPVRRDADRSGRGGGARGGGYVAPAPVGPAARRRRGLARRRFRR